MTQPTIFTDFALLTQRDLIESAGSITVTYEPHDSIAGCPLFVDNITWRGQTLQGLPALAYRRDSFTVGEFRHLWDMVAQGSAQDFRAAAKLAMPHVPFGHEIEIQFLVIASMHFGELDTTQRYIKLRLGRDEFGVTRSAVLNGRQVIRRRMKFLPALAGLCKPLAVVRDAKLGALRRYLTGLYPDQAAAIALILGAAASAGASPKITELFDLVPYTTLDLAGPSDWERAEHLIMRSKNFPTQPLKNLLDPHFQPGRAPVWLVKPRRVVYDSAARELAIKNLRSLQATRSQETKTDGVHQLIELNEALRN